MMAQTFVSPHRFDLPEGNGVVLVSQPFYTPSSRFQLVDGSQAPTGAKVLKALQMRRRPSEVPGIYPARTTTLTLLLAHTVFSATSPTFAANYKGNQATTVYSAALSLPDFSAGPLPAPAPWSITIPYTTSFQYNGNDDLLVELQCQGTSPVGQPYPLDTVDASAVLGGYAFYNGVEPCQVTGQPFPFSIVANRGPALRARDR
jgi:hypothetical protein